MHNKKDTPKEEQKTLEEMLYNIREISFKFIQMLHEMNKPEKPKSKDVEKKINIL